MIFDILVRWSGERWQRDVFISFIKIVLETRNVKRGWEMDVLSRDISCTRNFNLSNVCFVTWILSRALSHQAPSVPSGWSLRNRECNARNYPRRRWTQLVRSGANLKRRRGAMRTRRVGNQIKLVERGEHKESRKCTMHKLASCTVARRALLRLLNATLHIRPRVANCRLTPFP